VTSTSHETHCAVISTLLSSPLQSSLQHSVSLCSALVLTSFHIHTKQQVDITAIFYILISFGAKILTKEGILGHGIYPQCENRNLSYPLKLSSSLFCVIKSSCPAGLHRVPIYRIRTSLATAALLCLFHTSRGKHRKVTKTRCCV
jgi:hypothetical protein